MLTIILQLTYGLIGCKLAYWKMSKIKAPVEWGLLDYLIFIEAALIWPFHVIAWCIYPAMYDE